MAAAPASAGAGGAQLSDPGFHPLKIFLLLTKFLLSTLKSMKDMLIKSSLAVGDDYRKSSYHLSPHSFTCTPNPFLLAHPFLSKILLN